MSQTVNAAIAVVGIDIGKNSFHIVGHDERGAIVLRQKWSRGQVEARFANTPPCLIGMEACVGAHHLSRKLRALGHDARLMPAKYVRPDSKGQKNNSTARTDAIMAIAGPALPGLGDILSYTISPIVSRLMWPAMLRKIFGPKSVPQKFNGFPKSLAVRPSQLRAGAAEAALMVPATILSSKTYGELAMPIFILAGEDDRLIDIDEQSGRLHDEIKHSKMRRVPKAGHMIQQSDTADLMAAVDEAAAETLH